MVWGSFPIAAAALKTPTMNVYNAQGVNLTFLFSQVRPDNVIHGSYGTNAFKSLARSHPAVFQRHHPDLTLLSEEGRVVRK